MAKKREETKKLPDEGILSAKASKLMDAEMIRTAKDMPEPTRTKMDWSKFK